MQTSYEGEAPMRLEALCEETAVPVLLPLSCDPMGVWRSDWVPLVQVLLDGRRDAAGCAAIFHASLAQALCNQAIAVRRDSDVARVGLSGGVFQNRVLTQRVQALLNAAGFEVLIPERLPVNDAAISYGQLIEAAAHHGAHV
jgi:hydrogenase maturation protein HypF